MFFKLIDFLSPNITFYYKGYLSHSSIFSGILSIISMLFIIVIIIYYSLEVLDRKSPNGFYFNSFIEDAPEYEINSTSLFHFINIVQNSRVTVNEGIDFTMYRILGTEVYYENFIEIKNATNKIAHWLYGYCNNNTNTEGISHLIKYDFFEKAACIKKYFDPEDKKYYDIGDPKFKFPNIAHGTSNEKSKLYNFFIQPCSDQTIGYILGEGFSCRKGPEISEYFRNTSGARVFHLYLLNNYVNILDFDKPNKKSFYRIENPLSTSQFSENFININPSTIKTHYGLIFDKIKEEISYNFERNDVYIHDGNNFYSVYCLFLKNVMNYYERSYKRIQDIITSIGGFYQVITIIAIFLNNFYHSFVVLSDTEILLHNSIVTEKTIFEKKNNDYKKLKSNLRASEKNLNKKKKDIKKSPEKIVNNTDIKTRNRNEKYKIKNNSEIIKSNNLSSKLDLFNDNKYYQENKIRGLNTLNNMTTKEGNIKAKTFWNYIVFKFTCKKKNNYFNVYNKFRIRIISEEHLIRNHLNIYNLLKVTEKKRTHKRISYQIKDLINMV